MRLSAGQRHESVEVLPLLEETLERMWPDAVAGDKGYSTAAIRNWLAQREIEAVIPKRENEMGPKQYDREAYRERTIVERTINRLKRYRRIATRGTRNWQPPTWRSSPSLVSSNGSSFADTP